MKWLGWILAIGLVGWRLATLQTGNADQVYPNKPIEIVVPYLAGGGTDVFTRLLQRTLNEREELDVPVVIVNQDGGSATIGSRMVKDSDPDGYRLLCHHEGIIATKLGGVVDYGPEAFRPIAQTASIVLLMVVRADSPYQSLPDLLEAAQREPNKIRMGANQGSPAYFICKQLLAEYPGAEFNFTSASGSKRCTYLLGGKLEAGIFSLAEYVKFRKESAPDDDNVLAIGNFSEERHPRIPDVATSMDQGLKTSASNAYYVWAPRETPDDIAGKLASALEAAIGDEQLVAALDEISLDPKFRSGRELEQHLAKRVAAFERLAVKADAQLPNFVGWTFGFVALLGVWVVFDAFLRRPDLTGEPLTDGTTPNLNKTALGCFLILCGYILCLQMELPFSIATFSCILLMGWVIANFENRRLPTIIQIAILVALGIELVFTQVFTVALP